jgi:hypothetical protein
VSACDANTACRPARPHAWDDAGRMLFVSCQNDVVIGYVTSALSPIRLDLTILLCG